LYFQMPSAWEAARRGSTVACTEGARSQRARPDDAATNVVLVRGAKVTGRRIARGGRSYDVPLCVSAFWITAMVVTIVVLVLTP